MITIWVDMFSFLLFKYLKNRFKKNNCLNKNNNVV